MLFALLIAAVFAGAPEPEADDPPEAPVEVLMPSALIEDLDDLEERLDERDAEIADLAQMAAELVRLVAEAEGVELPPVQLYEPAELPAVDTGVEAQ
jgi:hypothetical protein